MVCTNCGLTSEGCKLNGCDQQDNFRLVCKTCGDKYEPGDANYCCYGCFIIAGEEKDVK